MESQVTKPIEDVVSSINGLDKVSSTSSEGVSVVIAEFKLEKDPDKAEQEVRDKISSIRSTLPREILEPVIDKFDPASSPIISYAIMSKGNKQRLSDIRSIVEDSIKPQIERIDGVGSITIIGGLEREIHIDVNLEKLNSLNLSISQVTQAIRNENLNLPAGRVTEKSYDFLLRTRAEFKRVDELNNIIIANPGGNPVYLKDIAIVTDAFKTKRSISRVNGVECITIVLRKQSGTNTVKVAENVKKAMIKIQSKSPDLDIRMSTDESVFIKESRDDVINSLILGALLAGLVVLFSFGDIRNTIITIAGLPVCIIGTFAVMSLLGFTMNVITLLALSLSVGLLIDDAIVVRENIFRHMEKLGKEPKLAAYDGASEVGLAVTATTLTLIAVFLPVAFATGIAGKFFREFGITVSAAVLISLFEAFTFAPMLSAYFFRKRKKNNEKTISGKFQTLITRSYDNLGNNYKPILKWAVTHRKSMILITTIIFIVSLYLFTIIGTGGSPRGNRPEFNIVIQCASGSSLENTEKMVRMIEEILYKQPEVKDVFTVIGTVDGASDEATINVKLNKAGISKEYQDRLRPLLSNIPGVSITFQEAAALGGAAASTLRQLPIQINLKSNDLEDLYKAAEIVKVALLDVRGLVDVNTDYKNPKPEIQIQIDRERASRLGIGTFQIASFMRTFVDGDIASKFRSEEKLIDIRVRLSEETRDDLTKLSKVFLPTTKGGSTNLDQVAKLEIFNGPTQIKRKDRTRQIIIGANLLQGIPLNVVQQNVIARLRSLNIPSDVTFDFGGQVEQTSEQFQSLFISLILAIIFVYMVLASQFGSFLQPFAIMLALPLSIIGAVLGLLVADKLFDMVAFIGLIMLMGLVTKNSILLIDYTNVLRRRGINRLEAIIEAGATRLRPILMTSLAMILGMIPVAFGFGTSSDFRAPIAFTIIGGLISSTLLTLVVVPVVYSIIDDISLKVRRKK
jgi:HAE1 family hydrophobic/amphiphilic exporter-1